jgi:hypothetical protein
MTRSIVRAYSFTVWQPLVTAAEHQEFRASARYVLEDAVLPPALGPGLLA